jgi:hypothetical protein
MQAVNCKRLPTTFSNNDTSGQKTAADAARLFNVHLSTVSRFLQRKQGSLTGFTVRELLSQISYDPAHMVKFSAAVLVVFFYVQITSPISWYPPSELNKTATDRLQFLDHTSQKIASIEFIEEVRKWGRHQLLGLPPY